MLSLKSPSGAKLRQPAQHHSSGVTIFIQYTLRAAWQFEELFCLLLGHAEEVVLATLEKWLQEEGRQKGHEIKVQHVL